MHSITELPSFKQFFNPISLHLSFLFTHLQLAEGAGALHNIEGIMRKENNVEILKQNLKTSARKLKLGFSK